MGSQRRSTCSSTHASTHHFGDLLTNSHGHSDDINSPPSYTGDELAVSQSIKADYEDFNEEEPTEEELATLRRVGDKIPYTAWLVAVVELAERFTCMCLYYLVCNDNELTGRNRLWIDGSMAKLHAERPG
jgi:hypothetical protein